MHIISKKIKFLKKLKPAVQNFNFQSIIQILMWIIEKFSAITKIITKATVYSIWLF